MKEIRMTKGRMFRKEKRKRKSLLEKIAKINLLNLLGYLAVDT